MSDPNTISLYLHTAALVILSAFVATQVSLNRLLLRRIRTMEDALLVLIRKERVALRDQSIDRVQSATDTPGTGECGPQHR